MALKASVFIATSLDGFIARPHGDLDWLDKANGKVTKGEDCGYQAFMDTIDHFIMGRKTYEKVLSFGAWPYGDLPVIVLSRNKIQFPNHLPKSVSHSSESPKDLYKRLSEKGATRLYIDGGVTIQRFLSEGLLHDLTITLIPTLIGEGLSLFGKLSKDVALKHISTKTYDFGFVQLTYEINNLRS